MPPKRNGNAKGKSKAYQLATIDAEGMTVTDLFKKQWKIGKPVGTGGFGRLYQITDVSGETGSEYVIKIEPHENGPLFSELSFYQRKAKKERVEAHMSSHKLKKLGMPLYISSGQHEVDKNKYRFMIIPQYKTDLQKLFIGCKKQFPLKTVITVALQVLDVLEYLHINEYVHADIKAANLLLGLKDSNQVFLVDYGLARSFNSSGRHQPHKPDPKLAHDGTIEFTSRDAHDGCVPSRRGDLEILGYCCIQWLISQLPWEKCLSQPEKVKSMKQEFMTSSSLENLSDVPQCIIDYMLYVSELDYEEEPDYARLRSILKDGMKKKNITLDGKLDFSSATRSTASRKRKSTGGEPSPKRRSPAKKTEPKPTAAKKKATASKSSSSSKLIATPKSKAASKRKVTPNAKASPKSNGAKRAVKTIKSSKSKPSTSTAIPDLITDSEDESPLSNVVNKNNSSRRQSMDPRALKAIKKARTTGVSKKAGKQPRTAVKKASTVKKSTAVLHAITPLEASAMRKVKPNDAGSVRSPRIKNLQTIATQTSPSLEGLKGRRRAK